MKIKLLLVICLFLLTVKCDSDYDDLCGDETTYTKKEDCISKLNETIIEKGNHCCYVDYKATKNREGKEEKYKGCMVFNNESYYDLEAWKKDVLENNEVEYGEVYCGKDKTVSLSSCFLKLGLVSLFAILLI